MEILHDYSGFFLVTVGVLFFVYSALWGYVLRTRYSSRALNKKTVLVGLVIVSVMPMIIHVTSDDTLANKLLKFSLPTLVISTVVDAYFAHRAGNNKRFRTMLILFFGSCINIAFCYWFLVQFSMLSLQSVLGLAVIVVCVVGGLIYGMNKRDRLKRRHRRTSSVC